MKASRPRVSAVVFATLLHELQAGDCSVADLCEVTGLTRHSMLAYVKAMHRRRCLHIVDYTRDVLGRQRSPVYRLGEGHDKPRKAPDSYQITNARYRERVRLRVIERLAA